MLRRRQLIIAGAILLLGCSGGEKDLEEVEPGAGSEPGGGGGGEPMGGGGY